jgi:hypothetical protein
VVSGDIWGNNLQVPKLQDEGLLQDAVKLISNKRS